MSYTEHKQRLEIDPKLVSNIPSIGTNVAHSYLTFDEEGIAHIDCVDNYGNHVNELILSKDDPIPFEGGATFEDLDKVDTSIHEKQLFRGNVSKILFTVLTVILAATFVSSVVIVLLLRR